MCIVQPLIFVQRTGYVSINIYALSICKDVPPNGSISAGRERVTGKEAKTRPHFLPFPSLQYSAMYPLVLIQIN